MNHEKDTSLKTKEKTSNVIKSDKNKLMTSFIGAIVLFLILMLTTWIFDLNHELMLLIPIIIVVPFFYHLIKIKSKPERDLIKSANDTILFSFAALTTALLTLNTIPNYSLDLFDYFMKDRLLGCLAISYYTILLIVKAVIARFEFSDNLTTYKLNK